MQPILLHVCCGPCASAPFEVMRDAAIPVIALYYNPNIQPEEEYCRRLDTLKSLANSFQVQVLEGPYDSQSWQDSICGFEGVYPLIADAVDLAEYRESRRRRCRCCYTHRFTYLARQASDLGCAAIATSLSISPYQFIDDMEEIFSAIADENGIKSVFKDLSELYPRSLELSRNMRLYRQNYCGCSYSKIEAELERQARREKKRRGQWSHDGIGSSDG